MSIVQEAGWARVPVWTGAENLNLTGIRSPNHLARSESLYQLRYPVPLTLPITGTFANTTPHLSFTAFSCPYLQCIALQLPSSFSGTEYCIKRYDYNNLYLNQCCQVYLVMLFELKLYLTHAQPTVRAYEILCTNLQKYLYPFQTPRENRRSYFRELNVLEQHKSRHKKYVIDFISLSRYIFLFLWFAFSHLCLLQLAVHY